MLRNSQWSHCPWPYLTFSSRSHFNIESIVNRLRQCWDSPSHQELSFNTERPALFVGLNPKRRAKTFDEPNPLFAFILGTWKFRNVCWNLVLVLNLIQLFLYKTVIIRWFAWYNIYTSMRLTSSWRAFQLSVTFLRNVWNKWDDIMNGMNETLFNARIFSCCHLKWSQKSCSHSLHECHAAPHNRFFKVSSFSCF